MLLRKLRSAAFMAGREKSLLLKYNNNNKQHQSYTIFFKYFFLYSFLFCTILYIFFLSTTIKTSSNTATSTKPQSSSKCETNVSVYVYELPEKFNGRLLNDCSHLNVYTDMCPHVANRGLGQPLEMEEGSESQSWYSTHQFIAEMIFHARVENHPCRTWEPHDSTLFYVPFYGGLHASSKFREGDLAKRDQLAVELVEFLSEQPWWRRKMGGDHFMALGRTAWDFMRSDSVPDFGANSLLNLPQVKNMSVLTVERHPWQGYNQYGIPYPSYFHPFSTEELLTWQDKMRNSHRPHLFSFVGAPRVNVEKAAIRDVILQQCSESTRCNLLKCGKGASKCHSPKEVLAVMRGSEFCMQAPGDSFTRRSTFDSVLSGCIPVFFSPHTAYTQYGWYLPNETSEYSVYIEEDKARDISIEEELLKIPREKVERMRRAVIDLIPRLTYMHPNATKGGNVKWMDAVDVALDRLAGHVNS